MLAQGDMERLAAAMERAASKLEADIMKDIVRRIRANGDMTSSAEYQINRLRQMGKGDAYIKEQIQMFLKASDEEVERIYHGVTENEYIDLSGLYSKAGKAQTPFGDHTAIQTAISAALTQSRGMFRNITQTLGFTKMQGSKRIFTPLAEYYQRTLDEAALGVITGAFSYQSVLKKAVKEMTGSGLRTVSYASGKSLRIESAARTALMTGLGQITSRMNETVAEEIGTDDYEISYHIGARPEHQPWQGRVYSQEELRSVCGLGTVTGLCGINCYHYYIPFMKGVSVRNYTDAELDRMIAEENRPKSYQGKEYTTYQALQKQRDMELVMRKYRQDIALLKEGEGNDFDVLAAQARYRTAMDGYVEFSQAMGLPQQKERVYMDGLGRVGAAGRNRRYPSAMLENAKKDAGQYERYKKIIGDGIGTLDGFRQMKYNEPEEFILLKKKVDTYSEIDKKEWSAEFKQKSKEAYERFSKEDIYLSVHALSRLPRLNKSGYPNVEEKNIVAMVSQKPNYSEGESKLIFFDAKWQLVAVKNKETDDIVSIVRRKKPKEVWKNV